jgi:hypothetical protein
MKVPSTLQETNHQRTDSILSCTHADHHSQLYSTIPTCHSCESLAAYNDYKKLLGNIEVLLTASVV